MSVVYPDLVPEHLGYRYCPMCAASLAGIRDLDGHFRARCPECGWIYYPPNLLGVNVVIETPDGVVFLFPPEEPPESPGALPSGCVEFGESLEEAAVREAREETGLEVEVVGYLGRFFDRECPLGPMYSFFFLARSTGGRLRKGAEGPVAVLDDAHFPVISPKRQASQAALARYLEIRRDLPR